MVLLTLIINPSRGKENIRIILIFLYCVSVLGWAYIGSHLPGLITFMLSLIMIIFIHVKALNAFPDLAYFSQRNSNWFLLPDLVSVKEDLFKYSWALYVFTHRCFLQNSYIYSLHHYVGKMFPITSLFSLTALSSKLVMKFPSFSENDDTQSNISHIWAI